MNCNSIKPLILDYFEKNISGENAGLLNEHIRKCEKCRNSLIDLEGLHSILDREKNELLREKEYYFENLDKRIYDRIENNSGQTRHKKTFVFNFQYGIAAVVLLFSMIGGYLYLGSSPSENISSSKILEYMMDDPQISESDFPFEKISNEKLVNSDFLKENINLINEDEIKSLYSIDSYSVQGENFNGLDSLEIENIIQKINDKSFI